MSRVFIREHDAENSEMLPDRPISLEPNVVTPEGIAQIESRIAKERDAIATAQAAGDPEEIAVGTRELRYWLSRRASARIVQTSTVSNGEVRFGSTVQVAREDGRRQTFRIVGEDEADPSTGTISHVSPLARALFGKTAGDVARLGDQDIDILTVQ
jgi:transcription elongation GreA/GreB family factor